MTPAPTPTATPVPTATPTPRIPVSRCRIAVKDQVYTGKALTPKPTVTYNGKALRAGRDFTVAYSANINVGTATLTVTGKGAYTDSAKARFAINPKATKLTGVKAGSKRLTVTWTALSAQASGYQLEYGLKKDFSDARAVTVKGAAKATRVLKGLKSKAKYYVRVRVYKKVGKKTYWSAWSKAKRATVK